jgi:hypothetical protein
MNYQEILMRAVLKFLNVTYQCYKSTNYTEDRIAFQSDIALCAKWVLDIDNNEEIQIIISDILDESTVKYILDYYKQGKYGDDQAVAFEEFKKEVISLKLSIT